jgi:hypothetical protein
MVAIGASTMRIFQVHYPMGCLIFARLQHTFLLCSRQGNDGVLLVAKKRASFELIFHHLSS